MPKDVVSLWMRMSWSTVSKAALRSRRERSASWPESSCDVRENLQKCRFGLIIALTTTGTPGTACRRAEGTKNQRRGKRQTIKASVKALKWRRMRRTRSISTALHDSVTYSHSNWPTWKSGPTWRQ